MLAWAITLLLGLTVLSLIFLAVHGMSKPAKRVATAVVVITVALDVAAVIAYRNSTDGQTTILWVEIPIYGLLALTAVRLLDKALRALRSRHSRA